MEGWKCSGHDVRWWLKWPSKEIDDGVIPDKN
jgi:hypothetical protein